MNIFNRVGIKLIFWPYIMTTYGLMHNMPLRKYPARVRITPASQLGFLFELLET